MELPGLTVVEQEVPLQTAQFDLFWNYKESADGIFALLIMRLTFSADDNRKMARVL